MCIRDRVHRIQNRNPGYSDFSNLGVNTSFNFTNTSPISSGANALKLENEVMPENIQDTAASNNVNQINDQYHEELLKNQEMENVVENITQDDENSFTKDAIGDPLKENILGTTWRSGRHRLLALSLIHI